MSASRTDQAYRLRLEAERRTRARARSPLLEYVPRVSRDLDSPQHLTPIADAFERVYAGESIQLCITTPPQFGKSLTAFHGLVQLMQRRPGLSHAYATYAQEFARDQSREAQKVARGANLELEGGLDRWRARNGSHVLWTGVGGPFTGKKVNGLLIVDDLLKNREEAESPTMRQKAFDWLTSTAFTRLHPGASVLVIHTRWHPDDPIGRLQKQGWPVIELPAITDAGESLWPEGRPIEFLRQQERLVGEHDWWSLYMCQPRPRGGALFRGEPARYDGPTTGKRITVTVDLAASERKTADYTVLAAAAHWGGTNDDRGMDILKVERGQWDLSRIHEACHRWQAEYGVVLDIEQVANQAAVVNHIRKRQTYEINGKPVTLPGIRLRTWAPRSDKFARALPAAAAWAAGRIRVPTTPAPWLPDWLDEHASFTGTKADEHDDQVDTTSRNWDLGSRPDAGAARPAAGPTRSRTQPAPVRR